MTDPDITARLAQLVEWLTDDGLPDDPAVVTAQDALGEIEALRARVAELQADNDALTMAAEEHREVHGETLARLTELEARTTPPEGDHTITLERVSEGRPYWTFRCHHDDHDPKWFPSNEPVDLGCWLASWWEGVGDELLDAVRQTAAAGGDRVPWSGGDFRGGGKLQH